MISPLGPRDRRADRRSDRGPAGRTSISSTSRCRSTTRSSACRARVCCGSTSEVISRPPHAPRPALRRGDARATTGHALGKGPLFPDSIGSYLMAYGRIYANRGAMTPGVNAEPWTACPWARSVASLMCCATSATGSARAHNQARSSLSKVARKHRATIETPHGPRRCFEVNVDREGRKPLGARFGGIRLRRQRVGGPHRPPTRPGPRPQGTATRWAT
jgi:hypothetical protein